MLRRVSVYATVVLLVVATNYGTTRWVTASLRSNQHSQCAAAQKLAGRLEIQRKALLEFTTSAYLARIGAFNAHHSQVDLKAARVYQLVASEIGEKISFAVNCA